MDFFSTIGVNNAVEDIPHVPITLKKPTMSATKILESPHYSFLGLPITLANRRAPDHEYGYYDNGVFKPIQFAHIEYTGRMVFNKPELQITPKQDFLSKYKDEPWFTPDYLEELIAEDQKPLPEIPSMVATWVSSDPPSEYNKHLCCHYFHTDRKWYIMDSGKWIHIFAPSHSKLRIGWYKFQFKFSI